MFINVLILTFSSCLKSFSLLLAAHAAGERERERGGGGGGAGKKNSVKQAFIGIHVLYLLDNPLDLLAVDVV